MNEYDYTEQLENAARPSLQTLQGQEQGIRDEADRVYARLEQADDDGDCELAEILEDYYNRLLLDAGDAEQDVIDKMSELLKRMQREAGDHL